jgi:hypothetical protein
MLLCVSDRFFIADHRDWHWCVPHRSTDRLVAQMYGAWDSSMSMSMPFDLGLSFSMSMPTLYVPPTLEPTSAPTAAVPTSAPTLVVETPTAEIPSDPPSDVPSDVPTDLPTGAPIATDAPTSAGTASPTPDVVPAVEDNNSSTRGGNNASDDSSGLNGVAFAGIALAVAAALVAGLVVARRKMKTDSGINGDDSSSSVSSGSNADMAISMGGTPWFWLEIIFSLSFSLCVRVWPPLTVNTIDTMIKTDIEYNWFDVI